MYDKDLWLSAASLKNYYETEIKIKKFVLNSAFLLNISKLFIVINRVTKKSENYEFNAFFPFVFYLSCWQGFKVATILQARECTSKVELLLISFHSETYLHFKLFHRVTPILNDISRIIYPKTSNNGFQNRFNIACSVTGIYPRREQFH